MEITKEKFILFVKKQIRINEDAIAKSNEKITKDLIGAYTWGYQRDLYLATRKKEWYGNVLNTLETSDKIEDYNLYLNLLKEELLNFDLDYIFADEGRKIEVYLYLSIRKTLSDNLKWLVDLTK